jgi:hypothetical protein
MGELGAELDLTLKLFNEVDELAIVSTFRSSSFRQAIYQHQSYNS